MLITTLNNLHTPVHYYIRVRQGTDNANYRFVEYNYRNDVVNLNDGCDCILYTKRCQTH